MPGDRDDGFSPRRRDTRLTALRVYVQAVLADEEADRQHALEHVERVLGEVLVRGRADA